jgi:hypothetical protein
MLRKLLAFLRGNSVSTQQFGVENAATESDLTDAEQEEYVKLIQLVQVKCQFAESSLDNVDGSGSEDDVYETERVEKLINAALAHAQDIQDEFYRSAALQPIANILSKAGQYDKASQLIEEISVEFIQAEAQDFLSQQQGQ